MKIAVRIFSFLLLVAAIVNENLGVVKKAFSGFFDGLKIAKAFNGVLKYDKDHMHDGHKKVQTNKL